jgi:hypothetical protein
MKSIPYHNRISIQAPAAIRDAANPQNKIGIILNLMAPFWVPLAERGEILSSPSFFDNDLIVGNFTGHLADFHGQG